MSSSPSSPPSPSSGRRARRPQVPTTPAGRALRWARTTAHRSGAAAARAWCTIRTWPGWRRCLPGPGVPLEILVADRARRRRRLARQVRTGLRQLRHVLGESFPQHVTVIVQQVVCPATTSRQLAGCSQVGQRADGTRFAHVRLALQVDGHELHADEVLAALAEQCVGLAAQQAGSASVLIPIELTPARSLQKPAADAPATHDRRNGFATARPERGDPLVGARPVPPSASWTALAAGPHGPLGHNGARGPAEDPAGERTA
jgi:hypothetical protein